MTLLSSSSVVADRTEVPPAPGSVGVAPRPAQWRGVHAAIICAAAATIAMTGMEITSTRQWSPLVWAGLGLASLGLLALAVAGLTARGRVGVSLRDVSVALGEQGPGSSRWSRLPWSWRGRVQEALSEALTDTEWRPYYLAEATSVQDLVGMVVRHRRAQLGADPVDVHDARALLDFYEDRVRDVEALADELSRKVRHTTAFRWSLLSAVLVLVGLVCSVAALAFVPAPSGMPRTWSGEFATGPTEFTAVVTAWTNPNTRSSRVALEACPALAEGGEFRGFLLSSDDGDGRQDGPFTMLVADPRCAGHILLVRSGEGRYVAMTTPSPAASTSAAKGSTSSAASAGTRASVAATARPAARTS